MQGLLTPSCRLVEPTTRSTSLVRVGPPSTRSLAELRTHAVGDGIGRQLPVPFSFCANGGSTSLSRLTHECAVRWSRLQRRIAAEKMNYSHLDVVLLSRKSRRCSQKASSLERAIVIADRHETSVFQLSWGRCLRAHGCLFGRTGTICGRFDRSTASTEDFTAQGRGKVSFWVSSDGFV